MPPTYPTPGSYFVVDIRGHWVDGAIRAVTRSPWSHAGFVGVNGVIYEAEWHGFRKGHIDEYEGLDLLVSHDQVPDVAAATAKAEDLIGTPYNATDIAVIGLVSNGIKPGFLVDWASNEKSLICSQAVSVIGLAGGTDAWLCGKRASGLVTPASLGRRVEAEEYWRWP
jgi:hypothetical protein